jgi:hypothetical protein
VNQILDLINTELKSLGMNIFYIENEERNGRRAFFVYTIHIDLALSSLLFNFALKYAVRMVQGNN